MLTKPVNLGSTSNSLYSGSSFVQWTVVNVDLRPLYLMVTINIGNDMPSVLERQVHHHIWNIVFFLRNPTPQQIMSIACTSCVWNAIACRTKLRVTTFIW